MKNSIVMLICCCIALGLKAQTNKIAQETTSLPNSVVLTMKYDTGLLSDYISGHRMDSVYAKYTGVRIGEYYWMTRNFSHNIPLSWLGIDATIPISQATLDKYLATCFLDKTQFQVNIDTFNVYFGKYYQTWYSASGSMYEDTNTTTNGWGLPVSEDFQQLFALSPFDRSAAKDIDRISLMEKDVRIAFGAKMNSNPMAFDISDPQGGAYKTYWHRGAMGLYGFDMMPTGAQLNGDGIWYNGLGPIEPGGGWYGIRGDIYHLFYTSVFSLHNGFRVIIHDHLDTKIEDSKFHYAPIRWCRRLTDEELGYRLYVNGDYTDVIEEELGQKSANTSIPEGYTELPKGYFRGFYLQYIKDNPNPAYTIADIRKFAEAVDDRTKAPLPQLTSITSSKGGKVSIYPNPATDIININADNQSINTVSIYNIAGETIRSIKEETTSVDVSDLPSGIYIVRVTTTDSTFTQKISKK